MANINGTDAQGITLTLRRLELTDLAEPEKWNPNFQILVNNDAHLEVTKLSRAGGDLTGPVTFDNNRGVRGRSSGGATRNMATVTADNILRVGDAQLGLRLESVSDPTAVVGASTFTLLHSGNHAGASAGVHGVPSGYYLARSSRFDQLPAWVDIQDKPVTATRWPTWGEVSGKPSSFTPAQHDIGAHSGTTGFTTAGGENGTNTSIARGNHHHDSRYYTQAQIDNMLSGLPVSGHNHDDRYHTRAQITTLLNGKSDTSHQHDTRYVRFDTSSQGLNSTQQGNVRTNIAAAASSHTHDTRYVRFDTASQDLNSTQQENVRTNIAAAASSHTHAISDITNLQSSLNGKLGTSATAANSTLLGGQGIGSFVRTNASSTVSSGTLTVSSVLNVTGTLRIPVK